MLVMLNSTLEGIKMWPPWKKFWRLFSEIIQSYHSKVYGVISSFMKSCDVFEVYYLTMLLIAQIK